MKRTLDTPRPKDRLRGWVAMASAVALVTTPMAPSLLASPLVVYTPDDAREFGLESLRKQISITGIPLPNLSQFVVNEKVATALGKALFFDMAVGSDGIQACASCHFHAGADNRTKNQLSPGLLRVANQRKGSIIGYHRADDDPDEQFEVVTGVPSEVGPNYTLQTGDFPLVRDIGNGDNVSQVGDTVGPVAPPNSNDVVSSQGVFLTAFEGVVAGAMVDEGKPLDDKVFNVEGITTRRVEPRNTPSTINAVFNYTNFWDGRANNRFNGVNPFGDQDVNATIFAVGSQGQIQNLSISLRDASLASQAVGPPLSHFEMSFGNGTDNFRTWPEIGRKLIPRAPLETQTVAADDCWLGELRQSDGTGLATSYQKLIETAFHKRLWNSNAAIQLLMDVNADKLNQVGGTIVDSTVLEPNEAGRGWPRNPSGTTGTFSLMEANFAFFFGISVMLYEATLISDVTPFDQWMEGNGAYVDGFGAEELLGLNVFVDKGQCVNCHGGAEFTNASVRNAQRDQNVIEPMLMGNRQPAFYDNGFYNIGVTPTTDDVARGGRDPFAEGTPDGKGRPLAFSRQFAFEAFGIDTMPFNILGEPIPNLICDPASTTDPCQVLGFNDEDFGDGFIPVCQDVDYDGKCGTNDRILIKRVAVDGAFKTPPLRNVEFTGPYFHNGGVATLREVVEFYDRGGNFCRTNCRDLDPDINQLNLSENEKRYLVRFMLALSDDRVRTKAKPFDGPSLLVPYGHPGNENYVLSNPSAPNHARDSLLYIPATGAQGGPAIGTFLNADPFSFNPVTGDMDTYGDVRCSPDFKRCRQITDVDTTDVGGPVPP